MENEKLAESAYNAYRSASGLCEPLSGWELPEWASLGAAAKLSWAAVVDAMAPGATAEKVSPKPVASDKASRARPSARSAQSERKTKAKE